MDGEKFYVAVMENNDSRARADCEQVLVFGEPTGGKANLGFNWKHVALPCPSCKFVHDFKRSYWTESMEIG